MGEIDDAKESKEERKQQQVFRNDAAVRVNGRQIQFHR